MNYNVVESDWLAFVLLGVAHGVRIATVIDFRMARCDQV